MQANTIGKKIEKLEGASDDCLSAVHDGRQCTQPSHSKLESLYTAAYLLGQ
jgi:hypothetical protein